MLLADERALVRLDRGVGPASTSIGEKRAWRQSAFPLPPGNRSGVKAAVTCGEIASRQVALRFGFGLHMAVLKRVELPVGIDAIFERKSPQRSVHTQLLRTGYEVIAYSGFLAD